MVETNQPLNITLAGVGGQLELAIGAGRWTECWLVNEGRTLLGSDDAKTIIEALLTRFLDDGGTAAGEIAGRPVKWVLTLGDVYSRLYGSSDGASRSLYCMTLQGVLIGEIQLTTETLRAWRATLEALLAGWRAHEKKN